jgi:hypothetical protein
MRWIPWVVGGAVGLGLGLIGWAARATARPREAVYVRRRVIHGPGGFRYRLTDEDLLWLGRALVGEAGTNNPIGWAAIAWAMVQYHALVIGRRGRRPAFSSFTTMLREYCQPINPKWQSMDASGCRRRPEHCTRAHLQRRARIRSMQWGELPAGARETIARLVSGDLPNPVPGLVDWAATDWQSRSRVPLVDIRGNMFGVGRDRRLYQDVA